jgi:phosphoglycerate dehydrogenase-like enzyme
VILDDYQDVATTYADWSALPDVHVSTITAHIDGHDALARSIGRAEVLVAMRERTPITAELLDRLPQLRLLVTTGMRNASIDLEACRARDITVCGTSSLTTPTVELTWALIHGLTRNLLPETWALRGDHWQTTIGTDLAGATLGLLGLGRIGSRVAAVAGAFEMDVAAWSPHLTEERAAEVGVRVVSKLELFSGSDIVSLHLVLADITRGIVGAEELGAMRPSAYLVNTSRAGLVDTAALLEALDLRRIAGAGLDVFDQEPLPAGDRLRSHPRVLATPHLGYVTRGNYRVFFAEAVEDVAAWLAGEPVRVLP